jgi:STE24 endopeptidase
MSAASTPAPSQSHTGRAFTKRLRWAAELRMAALFVAVIGYCASGLNMRVALFAHSITPTFPLQLALAWLPFGVACSAIAFPVALYTFHLQRKFGLITGGFFVWFRDHFKMNALALFYGAALVEIGFLSNVLLPSFGWVCAGALYALLILWTSRALPWILSFFYPVVPLGDAALHARLAQLAAKARVRTGSIFEWRISGRTRLANAFVTGVGAVRRVFLTDTLISKLSPDEVEAIVAHELGHCALHHVAKRIFAQGVVFSAIFGCMSFAVHHGLVWFAGDAFSWTDLTLLPGFFLYWTCGRAYGNILVAAISRRQEKEADLYSWKLTGHPESFITGMQKLSDNNLIVFDRSSEWRYAHPATAERLAAAEKFLRENGGPAASIQSPAPAGSESD